MGVVPAKARLWQPLRTDGRCFAGDTRGSILVRRGNLEAAYRIRLRDTRMTALNTSDGTRCTFPASYEKLFRVGFPETLPAYLGNLESRITLFDLPLGADVVTRDNGEIVLEVPKVTFMDLFVYPTSTLTISKRGQNDVEISALDTEIHGSHHVESLDCNNRFELMLNVRLAAENDTMQATAKFQLDVDVPFPLNVTPKPAIELTGTTAVQRTLENLMDTLCASIVRDQVAWTKDNREASNAQVSEKATVTVA